ncbi:MAG: magnesium/cobalt transporter CorA [Thermoanaerobaculia bacterium]
MMPRFRGRKRRLEALPVQPPAPPGEIAHIPGMEYQPTSRITLIDFWGDHFIEKVVDKVEDCFEFAGTSSVTWINVEGLGNVEVIRKLGDAFKLHPLALEDVVHLRQRPKVDDYEVFLFLVFRELHDTEDFGTEQISIFLGGNYLITFQETVGDPFDGVRDRIRKGRPRLRSSGPDYLAYALLDAVMDSYFPILDRYSARIDALEEEASTNPTPGTPLAIQAIRRDLTDMRMVAWSTREMLHALQRTDSELISKPTQVYLRDVYDHGVAVMEVVDGYRDRVGGLLDIYRSTLSNKSNEIMKALTLISTIFLPLTFIVSVYGMNFENLPGARWQLGFWVVIAVMLLVAMGMLVWFRKRRWI